MFLSGCKQAIRNYAILMPKCSYKVHSTEMLFEYNHNIYTSTENGDLMPTLFEFVTAEKSEFCYVWKIKLSLYPRFDSVSLSESETGDDSVDLNGLYSVAVSTDRKLVPGDTALVTITINESVCFDGKFDSEAPLRMERNVTNLVFDNRDDSCILVKIKFYRQDKSVDQVMTNYNKFLENESFSDVRFVFEDSEILAHKNILSSNNSIFKSMFESEDTQSYRVEINDVEQNIFKNLLQFVYYGKVYISDSDDWLKLIEAAHKYSVASLVKVCEERIINDLTTDNVIDVFVVADQIKAKVLKLKCMSFIFERKTAVVKTESYKNLVLSGRADLVSEILRFIIEKV